MPKLLAGKPYYSAQEAAKAAGISKVTLFRWIKKGLVRDAGKRDRNNWRWFSEAELVQIKRVASGGGLT
jgi:DNA-binding transcriptional MerR regulator